MNSTVQPGGNNPGDQRLVVCNAGYTGMSSTFTCNSGNWAGSCPTCTPASVKVTHELTFKGSSLNSNKVSRSTSVVGVQNQLYLAAITSRNHATVTSVTGLGLTWTRLRDQCSGRSQTGVEVWKAIGTPTGNGIVTAMLNTTVSAAVIAVSRYSGVDALNPTGSVVGGNTKGVDSTVCSGGVDTATYSVPVTTSGSNSVIYGAVSLRNRTHTPGSGYAERYEFSAGSSGNMAGIAGEDKTIASPSTAVVNGSFSGSIDWAVVAVEIKPGK